MKVKLDPGAKMPTRAHSTDAGLDLYARESKLITNSEVFDTGVHIELPPGTVGMIKSRSGMNTKRGLVCEGVIDEGDGLDFDRLAAVQDKVDRRAEKVLKHILGVDDVKIVKSQLFVKDE